MKVSATARAMGSGAWLSRRSSCWKSPGSYPLCTASAALGCLRSQAQWSTRLYVPDTPSPLTGCFSSRRPVHTASLGGALVSDFYWKDPLASEIIARLQAQPPLPEKELRCFIAGLKTPHNLVTAALALFRDSVFNAKVKARLIDTALWCMTVVPEPFEWDCIHVLLQHVTILAVVKELPSWPCLTCLCIDSLGAESTAAELTLVLAMLSVCKPFNSSLSLALLSQRDTLLRLIPETTKINLFSILKFYPGTQMQHLLSRCAASGWAMATLDNGNAQPALYTDCDPAILTACFDRMACVLSHTSVVSPVDIWQSIARVITYRVCHVEYVSELTRLGLEYLRAMKSPQAFGHAANLCYLQAFFDVKASAVSDAMRTLDLGVPERIANLEDLIMLTWSLMIIDGTAPTRFMRLLTGLVELRYHHPTSLRNLSASNELLQIIKHILAGIHAISSEKRDFWLQIQAVLYGKEYRRILRWQEADILWLHARGLLAPGRPIFTSISTPITMCALVHNGSCTPVPWTQLEQAAVQLLTLEVDLQLAAAVGGRITALAARQHIEDIARVLPAQKDFILQCSLATVLIVEEKFISADGKQVLGIARTQKRLLEKHGWIVTTVSQTKHWTTVDRLTPEEACQHYSNLLVNACRKSQQR